MTEVNSNLHGQYQDGLFSIYSTIRLSSYWGYRHEYSEVDTALFLQDEDFYEKQCVILIIDLIVHLRLTK